MKENQTQLCISTKKFNWLIISLMFLTLTLTFHFVPFTFKAFPKEHMTFKNTIIFPNDIDKIIERYNNSSILQQNGMRNDSFIKTLFEEGLISDNK